MKIAFDIGGVLSKYPALRELYRKCFQPGSGMEAIIITDMPLPAALALLDANGIPHAGNVYSACYEQHGELCKTRLCEQQGIDILIDDFMGYLAHGKHVRLLVMPDPQAPYYADDWHGEGFGFQRVRPT